MICHYLVTLYRALTRHRLYAALNVLGLAVGIAVFLTLSLYVAFETGFERWIPEARSIYVVRTAWTVPGHALDANNYSMGGLLEELRADYPQLIGTRVSDKGGTVRRGSEITPEQIEVVDPNFFQVFNLPLVFGDKASALHNPTDLLLSATAAKRYFGDANPLGQPLTLAFDGKVQDYRVAGVIKDPPKSTDLTFDLVVPLTPQTVAYEGKTWSHWGSEQLSTYLKFDTPTAAAALDRNMDAFTDRHGAADMGPRAHTSLKLRTQPLLSLHLLDPKDAAVVDMLGVVGLLTLLLAAVNYVNLATARAGLRAREVAIRKVMGATGVSLIAQFMAEAIATTAIAALIGLALCELALPLINAAGGLSLKIVYIGAGSVLPLIFGLVLVVGLGAGLYPALVLSRFQPAGVLAAARTPGGGRIGGRVREALVIFQFAVAIAFTIGTAVIFSETRYLRHADLGFNRDGLIVVKSFPDSEMTATQRSTLLGLWRATPGVTSATAADIGPGEDGSTNATNFKRPGMKGDGPSLNWVTFGSGFMPTYQARLIAGRAVDGTHGLDDFSIKPPAPGEAAPATSDGRNVMLNANAVKVLGFDNPQAALGQTVLEGLDAGGFKPLNIVGVVDNIRFRSPKEPVPATLYFYKSKDFQSASAGIRYAQADPRTVMDRIRAIWKQVAPTVPFRGKTIQDNLQHYYRADDQRGRLFTLGAVLAVAIGCLGLYGLASFNTARRVREIGIRKTLGASTADILKLLIGQFLRPVLIANLIAWPLAFIVMRSWLTGFDQRIFLSPLYFLAATLLTLAIAVATVAGQAYAVARAEPAKALRHE